MILVLAEAPNLRPPRRAAKIFRRPRVQDVSANLATQSWPSESSTTPANISPTRATRATIARACINAGCHHHNIATHMATQANAPASTLPVAVAQGFQHQTPSKDVEMFARLLPIKFALPVALPPPPEDDIQELAVIPLAEPIVGFL